MAYEFEDEGEGEGDEGKSSPNREDLIRLLRTWREEDADDLPDDLPAYEQLANDDGPIPEPELPRRREDWTGATIVTFVLILLIAWAAGMLLHQQYDQGYVNGSRDGAAEAYQAGLSLGYQNGEGQGKQEALIGLQEWQYKHNCAVDAQGFVRLKMSRDSENRYQFECVVEGRK